MPGKVEITFQIDAAQARRLIQGLDADLNKTGEAGKKAGQEIEGGLNKATKASQNMAGSLGSAFQVFSGTIIAQYFQQGVSSAIAFGKSAIDAINAVKAAQIGLASVAAFKGISGPAAQDAI